MSSQSLIRRWVCAGVLLAGVGSADTVLFDTFSDGSRDNQSLPDSANWIYARTAADGYISTEGTFVGTNNSAGTGFIAPLVSTQILSVGQSLQLSFDYQYGSNNFGDMVFRVNLLSSGGVSTTNDNTGFNNAVFNGWRGYGFSGQFGTNGGIRYRVNERATTANNLFSGYSILNSGIQTNGGSVSTWYNARLTLNYLAVDNMQIIAELGGQTLVATDTAGLVTSFDQVGILASPNSWMAIDNVSVVSVVPEPSVALLLAAGLLVAGMTRRRHVA